MRRLSWIMALFGATLMLACPRSPMPKQIPPGEFTQVPFTLMDGSEARLADYEGQVLLLVNVASKCGFTKQYAGLQDLYERYGERGLVIIGFPANNFMRQEPGSNEEIQEFCRVNFGVSFPMAEKISVRGKDAHPLYQHLVAGAGDESLKGAVKWNFTKFLVGRDGRLVARFGSRTAPEDEELLAALEAALEDE